MTLTIFRRTRLFYPLYSAATLLSVRRARRAWEAGARTGPAPGPFKRALVRGYGRQFGCQSLIETGTFRGEMLWANRHAFHRLYSVEASPVIFEETAARFRSIGRVQLRLGPSTQWLPQFIAESPAPRLFWLDAHYSGGATAGGERDAPIVEELEIIFQTGSSADVILVDDARLFHGNNGYPSYQAVAALAERNGRCCYLEHDVIRIHTGQPAPPAE